MENRPWIGWIAIALGVYLLVSMTAFRFSHPEMTETQLLMHVTDAILWKG